MNVGELIDYLATQPRDQLVVLASDAEGNSYAVLHEPDIAMYPSHHDRSDCVWITHVQLDAELADPDTGWSEDDRAPDNAETVIVLYPA